MRVAAAFLAVLLAAPAFADHYGDIAPGSTIVFSCSTMGTTGPATLSGGAVACYKDASNTETTTGCSIALDQDRTGRHVVTVDTSADGTFYSAGSTFEVIITAGTVSGTSFVGLSCGSFSLNARSALRPTTAGRTLDVSAGGEAGVDLANVGSPTTTLNLSGTTVAAVSGAVGSVTGNVGGNVTGSVASVTGNVGGNVTGSVGSVASGGITAASIATGAVDADALAADAGAELADATWDEATPHNTASTMGALLHAAGSAGDPWATNLPGSYSLPQAGAIVGNRLDQAVSTRMAAGANVAITTTPVAPDGTVTIFASTDFIGPDALIFRFDSEDFSDVSAVTLRVRNAGGTTVNFTGSVLSSTQLKVEIPADNALTANATWKANGYVVQTQPPYLYQVHVTRTSPTRSRVPFGGGMIVRERLTP